MIISTYAKKRIFFGWERTLENVRSGFKKYDIPIPKRTFSKVRLHVKRCTTIKPPRKHRSGF